jgi:hypothetical protein
VTFVIPALPDSCQLFYVGSRQKDIKLSPNKPTTNLPPWQTETTSSWNRAMATVILRFVYQGTGEKMREKKGQGIFTEA